MNCIICGKPTHPIFYIGKYELFECRDCEHRQTRPLDARDHLKNVYSDEYFKGGGTGYPDYLRDKNILIEHGRYYSRLLSKHIASPGYIADIGSAAGFILKGFVESGWRGFGVEPNDTMAGYARENLGLDVRTAAIEDITVHIKVDLICMIQAVAHFMDPLKVVEKCRDDLLKTTGFVLIETWNFRSLTARLLGKKWHEYSPPSVLHWFSVKSLDALMMRLGFKKVASGNPRKIISVRHVASLLRYKSDSSILAKSLYSIFYRFPSDLKLSYLSDDLRWTLYSLKK